MAIERQPTLSASYAGVQAAQAKASQAEAAFYPKVNFSATESRGKTYNHFGEYREPDRELATRQYTFRLTQPLYQPRLTTELEQSRLGVAASRYDQQAAYEKLSLDVLNVFFDILAANVRLELFASQRVAVEAQKVQARRSFDIGTVSITDVREAEAKLDTLLAQTKTTEYELQAKQAELQQITGMRITPTSYQASLSRLPELDAAQLSRWLFDMEHNHAQLQQAKRNYDVAQLDVYKTKREKYPTVDLNLSTQRNIGDKQRVSTSTDEGWTFQAGVAVNVPILDGGGTNAKIAEATALSDKSYHDMLAVRQQATIELKQVFFSTLSAVANYHGLKAAQRSNETALAANQKGYEVGMRVNADVLDAQSKLFEVRKDQLEAWYTAWRSYIKLRQLTGKLQSSDLKQLDTLLQTPALHQLKTAEQFKHHIKQASDDLPFAVEPRLSHLNHDLGYDTVNEPKRQLYRHAAQ